MADKKPEFDIDKAVKIFVKMRDAKADLVKKHTEELASLEKSMAVVQAQISKHMLELGMHNDGDKIATQHGTAFFQTTMKCNCEDWSAFGTFLEDNDPLDYLEKRVRSAAIKEYMEATDGALPPGINIHRERELRIRRASSKSSK